MSSRPWQQRVQDMLDAIAEIDQFCAGMTFGSFSSDKRTQKAVSADFAILGEAATSIPAEVTHTRSDVPCSLVRKMRNFVVHAYFAIDREIVWDTIQNDLTPLKEQFQDLLRNPPS